MELGKTQQYAQALEALQAIKAQYGSIPELKAIATYLLYSNTAEQVGKLYPWTTSTNPQDIAIAQAYAEQWRLFVNGEDLPED
jgi:hypothetical protein